MTGDRRSLRSVGAQPLAGWRVVVALVVAMAVLGVGCSRKSPTDGIAKAQAARLADGETPPEDPAEELLNEQPLTRKVDRLIAESVRVHSLCEAWNRLDRLEQPEPDDIEELADHTEKVYNLYFAIDPTRKVRERVPAQRGRPATVRNIELPKEVQADIDTVRKATYSYWVRVTSFDGWRKAGYIDDADYERRMQRAFALFTSDEVTEAQRRLIAFEATHCHI